MFKKSRRKKLYLNPYQIKSRRRRTEWKRGIFRKKRTVPNPKIYLTTPRFRAREASGNLQRKIALFLFILALSSFFYLLFFFPFWEIKQVNILGTQNIKEEEVERIVKEAISGRYFFIFPKRNLILTSKRELIKKIEQRFAQIDQIEIKKEFPDLLKITIIEKAPIALWATGAPVDLFLPAEAFASDTTSEVIIKTEEKEDQLATEPKPEPSTYPENAVIDYYFVNQDGILGDQIPAEKIYEQNLPIIYDQSFQKFAPRDQIVTKEFLEFIFLLRELLPLKTGIEVKELLVPMSDSYDLYVKTQKGYQIFFDTKATFQSQLDTLVAVLKEDINKNNKEVKYYIDLRVEGMVYYK